MIVVARNDANGVCANLPDQIRSSDWGNCGAGFMPAVTAAQTGGHKARPTVTPGVVDETQPPLICDIFVRWAAAARADG